MKYRISDYNTLIFDCDGVVLDSNKVKTEAFYQATLPYGKRAAEAMVEYHVANGGISRYKKFDYFIEKIATVYSEKKGPSREALLEAYADYVRDGLMSCAVSPRLKELREKNLDAKWLIVSGGDQVEIREVFAQRGIAAWFNGGIFGSPHTKDEILAHEIACKNIQHPALFLGDSKYDYQAAITAGLHFLFVGGWSEVADWQSWVKSLNIAYVDFI